MGRPKLATTWLSGCSGCHISLVDLDLELLDLADKVELTTCPPLTDMKDFPEVDIALVEGAVSTEDNERTLLRLRERSRVLVALGTCASYGGIPGLRNLVPAQEVIRRTYGDGEITDDGCLPSGPDIPRLLPWVRAVGQVVEVDAIIPGCPPTPGLLQRSLQALLQGQLPDLPRYSLCRECPRTHEAMSTRHHEFVSEHAHALCELEEIDPDLCFIEQGVPCLGPATRAGCGARCLACNSPCRGCMGPTPNALEQGAQWVNAVGSLQLAGAISMLDDVVGLGYRFSLPISLAPHVVHKESDTDG